MKRFLTTVLISVFALITFAQSVPQVVNFSATVRDVNNNLLVNTPVNVRLTFFEGGENGTPVYCALHQTVTNANGFMSFQLNRNVMGTCCNGAPNTNFADIPWENGNYWMQVEYQSEIGGQFYDLGYLELNSSFYALVAQKAISLVGMEFDVVEPQDGDVLTYNASTGKWEARPAASGSGGGSGTASEFTPTIATNDPTCVSEFNARLNGTASSGIVADRGFVYSTSPTFENMQVVNAGAGCGDFYYELSDLQAGTTYYYRAYANVGTVLGEIKSFTVTTTIPSGDYVDLGLPSGLKWASKNVGASTPEAYGNYYAWGETTTKTDYSSSTYTYTDNPTTLPASADAATVNMGSPWRMPTKEEYQELIDNCTWQWTTLNGVNGYRVIGTNGNSIFLPAAGGRDGAETYDVGSCGDYWSSSVDGSDSAWDLYFGSGGRLMSRYSRYNGFSVRPVRQ